MNSTSNVTVIIPCYNDGQYIMQALQSIYNQTILPEGVIIIDDGSNEETKKVLVAIKHVGVKIVYQENKGVGAARNHAISLAQTEYILNLDADDYFEPTFIEKAVNILNHNNHFVAVSGYYRVFEKNKTIKIIKPGGGNLKDFIVINNCIANTMFRKKNWEAVGGFDEKMQRGYEDWEFWISVLKNEGAIHIVEEVLSHYRIKKTSRDQTALVNYDFELRKYIYTKHKEVYQEHIEFYILELLRQNSMFRNSVRKIRKDVEYTIGYNLLKPLRFVKKMFKR